MTGDLILRQGGPGVAELSFGNLVFENRFTNGAAGGHAAGNGTIGITADGLLIQADHTYTDLSFDLMYKQNPVDFDRAGRSPLVHLGWKGGLSNAQMEILPGGGGAITLWAIAGITQQTDPKDYCSVRNGILILILAWQLVMLTVTELA